MTRPATIDAYGSLIEPATLKIERVLPGPVERIWAYVTESELRSKWLAEGDMPLEQGAEFELVWRNSKLSDPPSATPEGFPEEQRMQSRVVDVDAPRRLVITWGTASEVTFHLEPMGGDVLLTIIHRRLPDRASKLNVSAGWHAHLDVLSARLSGAALPPFWPTWAKFKKDYEARLPA